MTASYLSLKTPLDGLVRKGEKFNLQRIKGEETLCGDFSYHLEACCPERLTEEEIEKLVGSTITIRIGYNFNDRASYRLINGLVYKLRELGMSKEAHLPEIWQYRLEIGSWLHQLSLAKDCRIFQKNGNTALTIITDLLTELGLRDFHNQTKRALPKRNYVTLYNETYYDFILRLLQEEGIVWRFEHQENKHLLNFFDATEGLREIAASSWSGQDKLLGFCRKSSYLPTDGCQLADYEYDNPPEKIVGKPGKSAFRYFEYPGNFTARSEGEDKSSRLNAVLKSEHLLFQGTSTVRMLEAGKKLTLIAPALQEYHDQKFILTQLAIEASAHHYQNSFTAIPAKAPFYYPLASRKSKPRIVGNQTAFVVGNKNAAGSQIDEQGRILVRFHWDRHSPANTGSAFIRNVMPAAGARRGFIFHPQVGDEVVVAFENGDPDRPLVIGKVYSANQRPPVAPENNPEQSVIQPRNEPEANRIVLDDKSGVENMEFRAKKDMKITVGTDLNINVNENLTILADNLEITANGNVLTGNIVTISGGDIVSNAGKKISNITGLVVANIVGGLTLNKAGGNVINAALGMVNSKSGGLTVSAAPMIFNTTAGSIDNKGKNGVKNIGLIVANTAMKTIENSSGKKVNQKANLAILTNAKTESNAFDKESSTKTLLIKDKGNMVINK